MKNKIKLITLTLLTLLTINPSFAHSHGGMVGPMMGGMIGGIIGGIIAQPRYSQPPVIIQQPPVQQPPVIIQQGPNPRCYIEPIPGTGYFSEHCY